MKNVTMLLLVLLFGIGSNLTAQTMLTDQAFVNDQITGPGVYTVEAGKMYFFDGRLDIGSDITIEGPDADWIRNQTNPPVLLNVPDNAGAAQQFLAIETGGRLTIKNLLISGLASNEAITGDLIVNNNGDAYTADNVAFCDWSGRVFRSVGPGIDISITNNVFINGVGQSYAPWGGFPLRVEGDPNSCLIENNTVVNSSRLTGNGGPWLETVMHEVHNTYVNGQKNGHELRANEMLIANNLFYNYDWLSSDVDDIIYERYFPTWNFFAEVSHALDSVSLYFGQNAFFKQQELLDWYTNVGSTLDPQVTNGLFWEFPDTDSLVAMDDDYTIGTNYKDFDPGFAVNPDNLDAMIEHLGVYWTDQSQPWVDWQIASPVTYDGQGTPMLSWPPAFDLSYSNSYLQTAGTDGLPVGDLNWFPSEKATYQTNRDAYFTALRDSIDNATGVYVPEASLTGLGATPFITPSTVSVEDKNNGTIPAGFSLDQNYPNPFNPTTAINYSIGRSGNVKIELFNALGQTIATLVDEHKPIGNYTLTVDASGLTSGVYFYSINAGDFKETKKMLLMK